MAVFKSFSRTEQSNTTTEQSSGDVVTSVNVNSHEESSESGSHSEMTSEKIQPQASTTAVHETGVNEAGLNENVNEKGVIVDAENVPPSPEDENSHSFAPPDEHTQRGVADMEAVTKTWSRRSLILLFVK